MRISVGSLLGYTISIQYKWREELTLLWPDEKCVLILKEYRYKMIV